MKKFFYQAASFSAACLAIAQLATAQAAVPPVPPVAKTEPSGKGDQTEIVIRQKGDKDAKLTLEIKNGEYFINGKPLEKFDDQNVIVEKREMDEDIVVMPNMAYSPSPFRNYEKDADKWRQQQRSMEDGQRQSEDVQRRIQKNIQIRMNSAFLGVSSRRAEKGGATVLEVTKASPAEKAGIKKGDVITRVNDAKVESPESLYEAVHNYKPGEKVKIVFLRDGKEQTVTATLEKSEYKQKDYNYNYNFSMPPMPDMGDMHMDEFWGSRQPKIGITAQDSEDGKGVNVLEVEDSSAASKAGLRKGDIILQFDGNEVNSANELADRLQEARHKSIIKVKILRGTANQEIEIKIPRKLKTAEL